MQSRAYKQIRCIKRYAHACHISMDNAGMLWVITGCAAQWAQQN